MIRLIPVGAVDHPILARLGEDLFREISVPTHIDKIRIDPSFAFHPERRQYHSSEILATLGHLDSEDSHLLGVTGLDLYVPILTFVFGEAVTGGRLAIVSYHRLRQQAYGLESDDALLRARLLKESLHEIGHLLALHHCDNYECVMASSHSVEWIDLKKDRFCSHCAERIGLRPSLDSSLRHTEPGRR